MKKIQKTFAERAKVIQKRYPRSEWDAIERKDMLKELRALKDEQEQVRSLMEVADQADKMDAQGVIMPRINQEHQFGPVNPQQDDGRFKKWAENVPGMPTGYDINPEMLDMPGSAQKGGLRAAPQMMYTGGGFDEDPTAVSDSTKAADMEKFMRSQGYGKDQYGQWTTNSAKNDYWKYSSGTGAATIPGTGIKSPIDMSIGLNKGPLYPKPQTTPYQSFNQMQNPRSIEGTSDSSNNTLPYSPSQNVKDLFTPWGQQMVQFPQTPAVSRRPAGYPQQTNTGTTSNAGSGLIAPPAGMMEAAMAGARYNAPGAPKDNLSGFSQQAVGEAPYIAPEYTPGLDALPASDFNAADYAVPDIPLEQDPTKKFKVAGTSPLPFALSAGLGVIGDALALANANKGPRGVDLGRIAAQNVDMEPQRQQMRRDYLQAQNVNLRNSRDVSSPANAYANQIAGNANLMDSYGSAMGQSYMAEQNQNAQYRQQANIQNAQNRAKEAEVKLGLDMQRNQMKGQTIQSMAQAIPQALRDYRQQANQQNTINLMGQDMGMYKNIYGKDDFIKKIAQSLGVDPSVILARLNPQIRQG